MIVRSQDKSNAWRQNCGKYWNLSCSLPCYVSLCFVSRRIRTVIDNVYKYVKQQYNAPQKPPSIPISSVAEMHAFEKVDESTYSDVVSHSCIVGN